MLPKLARGLFLVVVISMIAAYTVAAATSSAPPAEPTDLTYWC
ncbi:MAG: hypothetical protein ACTHLO_13650 [Pseudolabrys sp.]